MHGADDATLLDRYHTRPGRTAAMLALFRDEQGRSSYDVITGETAALPRDAPVLDLACGDGHLLAMLAARGLQHLTGVDRSPEELSAARDRLGPGVTLHRGDAGALPLPDGSMAMVVCHMALMLIDPLDQALDEIARVLRPGGLFAAIINRRHPDPALGIFSKELRRATAEAGMEQLRLGPAGVLTLDGIHGYLAGSRLDAKKVEVHDFALRACTTPEGLWPFVEAMYDVFRLPAPSQDTLQQRLLRAWAPLVDEQGHLTAELGMRLITCPAAAAEEP